MIGILIGNVIALIASILMVYSGFIKNKKKIISTQTIQIALSVISNMILGGITGAIINFINCIRNILCYKDKLTKFKKLIIIVGGVVISLYFNNMGVIGLLPIIAFVIYTILMNIEDVIKFKLIIILSMIMWLIYDIYIISYTSAIFDFLHIIANIISIYKIKKV